VIQSFQKKSKRVLVDFVVVENLGKIISSDNYTAMYILDETEERIETDTKLINLCLKGSSP
jgi:hypothetical protein